MPYAWYPTKPIKTNRELLFRKVCRLLDANLSFYKFQPLGSWPDKFDLQSIKTTLPKSILYKCFCLVAALEIFSKGVIKKHKLNKILIYKKKKKNTHTHTHTKTQKYMKFYNFLLRVFIFWNHLLIFYYQFSLSIVNVSMTILFC